MNTTTQITLNLTLTGQLTIDVKNLEQILRSLQIQAPAQNPEPSSNQSVNQNQTHAGESSFINEKILMEKLPISRRTLFGWRMAGKIPTVKIGRRTLYHWPSVEAALLRCQRGEQSD